MKRLLAAIVVLAVFVPAGTAQADKAFSPTCGNNPGKGLQAVFGYLHHTGPPSYWRVGWYQNCGVGGTIEYEVQVSSDEGSHWTDQADSYYPTPSGKANQNTWIYLDIPSPSCSNNNWYRLKAYDTNSTASETDEYDSC